MSEDTRARATEVEMTSTACLEDPPNAPFKTIVETVLPMQIDCLSWNHKYNAIAIGAYELDKKDTSIRRGYIYLIELDKTVQSGFKYLQQKASSGILDLKWEPTEEKKLAVATSNSILIFQVDVIKGRPMLEVTHEVELTTMALFLFWINKDRIVFSDSGGTVSILDALQEQAPEIVESNQLHEYFVWVVHYDPDTNTMFSGADDGKLCVFHIKDLMHPAKHYKKTFEVGVTSVLTKDGLVAIGCYDDRLRVYALDFEEEDNGSVKISLIYHLEMHLGGAVWRTAWLPSPIDVDQNEYRVIVAAARNGVQIVSFNKSSWTWGTIMKCEKHVGKLAYGLDFSIHKADATCTVASCYFDNHILHVWKCKY